MAQGSKKLPDAEDLDRPEGFAGQRLCVVPRPIVQVAMRDPLLRPLMPTDAGYFPSVQHHRVERPGGAGELILIYCTRGQGWIESTSQRQTIVPGQLAVLPPGKPHSYGADLERPWSIYWLHLVGDRAADLQRWLTKNGGISEVGLQSSLARSFDEVIGVLEGGYGPRQRLAAVGLAWLLAMQLIAAIDAPRGTVSPVAQRIDDTIAHMRRNLSGRLTLPQLAAMAMVSPQHYVECFKQHTGFSPIDYFLRLRLRHAMARVASTSAPLKEIAAEVGFDNQLYFSRQFRRIYGAAPSAWRGTMAQSTPTGDSPTSVPGGAV